VWSIIHGLCQEHVVSNPYVFVVDDDDVVRRSIVKRLTRMNCTVRDFESGESLLQSMENPCDIPDVILLDFKMEGMNGVETLKALRETNSSVPVFILTAYAGGMDMSLVEKLGNCEVMLKNVDLTSLRHIVNGAMALKRLRMKAYSDGNSPEC
jgi:DNA-binding NtrC family response regulator